MKMTIDASIAQMLMKQWSRDYFTYNGLEEIIDYYDSLGYETEFCPECICGEWTEYGNHVPCDLGDLIIDYGYLAPSFRDFGADTEEEMAKLTVEALEEKTVVLKTITGNYIVREFSE